MRKRVRALLLTLLLAATVFSGYMVISILYQSNAERQEFVRLSALYYQTSAADETASAGETASPAGTAATPDEANDTSAGAYEPAQSHILPQFESLLRQNGDIGGWIRIEGTTIDYPVMFTPNEPQKYLRKAFDGDYSVYGVPFVGAGYTLFPRSENIVIYGHHMNDNNMFAPLVCYGEKSYWETHKYIEFSTLYESGSYEVFAAFSTDIESAEAIRCYSFINSADEADFNDFIDGIRAAALYDTGVDVRRGDKLLTLSTCAYHTENGRFVVLARQTDD